VNMLRREFVTLIGGAAAAWPLSARAEQPMPVIGYLNPGSREADAVRLTGFQQGLNDTGYIEGRNVAIEHRRARTIDCRTWRQIWSVVR